MYFENKEVLSTLLMYKQTQQGDKNPLFNSRGLEYFILEDPELLWTSRRLKMCELWQNREGVDDWSIQVWHVLYSDSLSLKQVKSWLKHSSMASMPTLLPEGNGSFTLVSVLHHSL